jgi:hypothetical protein
MSCFESDFIIMRECLGRGGSELPSLASITLKLLVVTGLSSVRLPQTSLAAMASLPGTF